MNQKDLYLFNTVKCVNFMRTFRPSSTPFNDFASPGLSNVKIHSLLTISHFNNPQHVFIKNTKEENKKTEFVQEGRGVQEETEIFLKPILIEHTLLDEKTSPEKQTLQVADERSQSTTGSKRKNEIKEKLPQKKKSKLMFKIVD